MRVVPHDISNFVMQRGHVIRLPSKQSVSLNCLVASFSCLFMAIITRVI